MIDRLTRSTTIAAAALTLGGATLALTAESSAAHAPSRPASTKKKLPPAPPKLIGELSARGVVTLRNSTGALVTHLEPGWYTLSITVDTKKGDFHLVGPHTNKSTPKQFVGDVLWGVHFVKGTFHYLSDADAHATTHVVSVS